MALHKMIWESKVPRRSPAPGIKIKANCACATGGSNMAKASRVVKVRDARWLCPELQEEQLYFMLLMRQAKMYKDTNTQKAISN